MEVKIRSSNLQDLEVISKINGQGSNEGEEIARQRLPSFIKDNNLFVAESDSEILGLLYFDRKFFDIAEDNNWFLTQITVREDSKRKGVGEKLLRYFLGFAKENEAKHIFLDALESNLASFQLIKKLGAQDAGYLDFGNGERRNFFRFDF